MKKIKTLFIGTSKFAVPILRELSGLDFIDLAGVVTQPDRPVGRHHSDFQASAVGQAAEKLSSQAGSPRIYKPEVLKNEAQKILESIHPELIIVASYGQMIPENMLDYPKNGCINVHASLLPKLRGAVPIPMAILNDLKKTGVTFQRMVKELDAGDIISSYEIGIDKQETTESLSKKLSDLAAENLEEVLRGWFSGNIKAISQDEEEATFCSQKDISKSNAQILPDTNVELAERMIRAFYPWPIAWGVVDVNGVEKRLKIFEASVTDIELDESNIELDDRNTQSDSILKLIKKKNKLFLPLNSGTLELLDVQLEGKDRKLASEYLFLATN